MKKVLKQVIKGFAFFVLAMIAVNMNACSKKSGSSSNPYGYYGNYGNGVYGGALGRGIGTAPDGSYLDLTFSGTNNGAAGATGVLVIGPGAYSSGCAIPPGQYSISTAAPGQFVNGQFANIQLVASNGMPVVLVQGWLESQYVQAPNGQTLGNKMFAVTNIPGCPTNFD